MDGKSLFSFWKQKHSAPRPQQPPQQQQPTPPSPAPAFPGHAAQAQSHPIPHPPPPPHGVIGPHAQYPPAPGPSPQMMRSPVPMPAQSAPMGQAPPPNQEEGAAEKRRQREGIAAMLRSGASHSISFDGNDVTTEEEDLDEDTRHRRYGIVLREAQSTYALPAEEGIDNLLENYDNIAACVRGDDSAYRCLIACNASLMCYALRKGSIRAVRQDDAKPVLLKGTGSEVVDLALSPVGSGLLASVFKDGAFSLWRLTDSEGGLSGTMEFRSDQEYKSLQWHPVDGGRLLAVSSRTADVWCAGGEKKWTLSQSHSLPDSKRTLKDAAFTKEGKGITYVTHDLEVGTWDANASKAEAVLALTKSKGAEVENAHLFWGAKGSLLVVVASYQGPAHGCTVFLVDAKHRMELSRVDIQGGEQCVHITSADWDAAGGFVAVAYKSMEPQDSEDDNGIIMLHVRQPTLESGELNLARCRFDYLMPFCCQTKLPIQSIITVFEEGIISKLKIFTVHSKPIHVYHLEKNQMYRTVPEDQLVYKPALDEKESPLTETEGGGADTGQEEKIPPQELESALPEIQPEGEEKKKDQETPATEKSISEQLPEESAEEVTNLPGALQVERKSPDPSIVSSPLERTSAPSKESAEAPRSAEGDKKQTEPRPPTSVEIFTGMCAAGEESKELVSRETEGLSGGNAGLLVLDDDEDEDEEHKDEDDKHKDGDDKQKLGALLFPNVKQEVGDHEMAEKVTGMLLELPGSEIQTLIHDPSALAKKISEAQDLLDKPKQIDFARPKVPAKAVPQRQRVDPEAVPGAVGSFSTNESDATSDSKADLHAVLQKHFDAQTRNLERLLEQRDRKLVLKIETTIKDSVNQKLDGLQLPDAEQIAKLLKGKVVSAVSQKVQAAISKQVNASIHQATRDMMKTVLPALSQQVHNSIARLNLAAPVHHLIQQRLVPEMKKSVASAIDISNDKFMNALTARLKKSVATALKTGVQDAFVSELIPVLTKSTQHLFSQVDQQLNRRMAHADEKMYKSLEDHLRSMKDAIDGKLGQIDTMKDQASSAKNAISTMSLKDQMAAVQLSMDSKDYGNALLTAIRARNSRVLGFLVSKLEPEDLLERISLDPVVSLSLASQLCVSLETETGPRLKWLRHTIASIPNISFTKKAPVVLGKIKARLGEFQNAHSKRRAQTSWQHRDGIALVLYELNCLSQRRGKS